ncbi:MAG: cytochrome b/b6 domain-containing protein [Methylococcales bacterium]
MKDMRRLFVGGAVMLGLLLNLLAAHVLAKTASSRVDPISVTQETDIETCLDCHGYKGFATPQGETGESLKRLLHVESKTFKSSVHTDVKCVDCHVDIEQMPHKENVSRSVDCVTCHKELSDKERDKTKELIDITENLTHSMAGLPSTIKIVKKSQLDINAKHYLASVHAKPQKDDPEKVNATCWDCHGAHDVFPMKGSSGDSYRINSPETCGTCHQKELKDYTQSVHGAPVKRYGKLEPAVCSDCHTAHKISVVEDNPAKLIITDNCGNCHEDYYESYRDTYHGQIVKLGFTHTAKCHDCHAAHDTRKVDDPLSMMHENNRLTSCKECHEDATEGYLTFHPHGTTNDYKRFPQMWITSKFMIGLLAGVFLFFWTHSLLWFFREKKEFDNGHHLAIRVEKNGIPVKQGQYIERFTKGWRIAHLVLAIAVMTLVITGTTVLFADSFWAPFVMKLMGGAKVAAIIHRIAAVTFAAIFFGHLVVIFRKIYIDNDRRFEWFGPHSLLPRLQDGRDFIAMCKWFFEKGPRPVFDRWTYWEKFDYWAPFWGMFIIGLSGLLLWFPSFFGGFMPGWVFNVATIIHGEEAFLAAVFLFSVHFFNCHFRPEKFPVDVVMFTGSMSLEEFKEERKIEYDRLVKEGQLEQYLVGAPSPKLNQYSRILGFALIGVGVIELILILLGFLQEALG